MEQIYVYAAEAQIDRKRSVFYATSVFNGWYSNLELFSEVLLPGNLRGRRNLSKIEVLISQLPLEIPLADKRYQPRLLNNTEIKILKKALSDKELKFELK